VSEAIGCLACGSINIKAGVKLRPKDLRDYFASTVKTYAPRVLMSLMRHTNLTTTTKYLQANRERIKAAVSGLGEISSKTSDKILEATLEASQNALQGQKTVETSIQGKLGEIAIFLASHRISYEKRRLTPEKFGGGGQSRTVDAADMSRVL
jgi:hypothetical protein